ncbi:MAG: hypothetical protein AAFQ52_05325 [Chloroflexota bacterium]
MDSLTVLYTYGLRGDFALLPRLHTFIMQLKAKHDTQVLVLDLGASCDDSVWHCEATKGRSTLLVLDGMGYHAVNVSGILSSADRDRLASSVTTGMVTERHGWRYFVPPVRDDDIVVAGKPTPALTLCIVARPAEKNQLSERILSLQAVEKAQVGMVKIDMGEMKISNSAIFEMPKGLKPDATIAASIELVEDEARQAQKRQS